jgi:hypothetical protein
VFDALRADHCLDLLDQRDGAISRRWQVQDNGGMISGDAKLLAKVLARRLDGVIASIAHPDQAGFIRGRAIHDNVLLARGVVGHHREHRLSGTILFVDQEN